MVRSQSTVAGPVGSFAVKGSATTCAAEYTVRAASRGSFPAIRGVPVRV